MKYYCKYQNNSHLPSTWKSFSQYWEYTHGVFPYTKDHNEPQWRPEEQRQTNNIKYVRFLGLLGPLYMTMLIQKRANMISMLGLLETTSKATWEMLNVCDALWMKHFFQPHLDTKSSVNTLILSCTKDPALYIFKHCGCIYPR